MQISKINFITFFLLFIIIFLFANKIFAKNIFSDIFSENIFVNKTSTVDSSLFENSTVINKNIFSESISDSNHEANLQKADLQVINTQLACASNEQPPRLFRYADMQRYMLFGGTPPLETKIKPIPVAIFATALTGVFWLQHEMQMNTIWKNQTAFKFQDDALEEIWIDKCGHFYGVYASSYFLREVFLASGFSWNAANNWGAAVGLLYSTYVEILDGFGEQWGFSPTDAAANVLGGLFFVAQNYYPSLQNITPKFHYIPSEWFGYKSRIPHEIFIDDYSSQAFFYSLNIHNMMPDSWSLKKYYPSWLELSIGYVVRNALVLYQTDRPEIPCSECISLQEGAWGSPRLVLALDYNMAKLLPDGGNTWNWFKQSLNLLKFPSPALEIGKVTRFYLLFPFKIL